MLAFFPVQCLLLLKNAQLRNHLRSRRSNVVCPRLQSRMRLAVSVNFQLLSRRGCPMNAPRVSFSSLHSSLIIAHSLFLSSSPSHRCGGPAPTEFSLFANSALYYLVIGAVSVRFAKWTRVDSASSMCRITKPAAQHRLVLIRVTLPR